MGSQNFGDTSDQVKKLKSIFPNKQNNKFNRTIHHFHCLCDFCCDVNRKKCWTKWNMIWRDTVSWFYIWIRSLNGKRNFFPDWFLASRPFCSWCYGIWICQRWQWLRWYYWLHRLWTSVFPFCPNLFSNRKIGPVNMKSNSKVYAERFALLN